MFRINRKTTFFGVLLSLLCILGFQIPAPAEWQKPLQPSMAGGALTCLASHPFDATKFLVASGHQIFEAGKENTWQTLWSQADANASIKKLFSFSVLPNMIFAITDRSIYMGNLTDLSWRMIYRDTEKTPLAFAVHPQDPNHWLVGTQRGLWETQNAGKTWSPSAIFRSSNPVSLLFFHRDRLLLADEKTLYLAMPGNPARSVLELPKTAAEDPGLGETVPETSEEPLLHHLKIRDLIASKHDPRTLFLATNRGVFQSRDSGHRWEPLPQSGLQSASVLQLACSSKEDRLYAATPRGVYTYDPRTRRWTGLFEGLATRSAQNIALWNEERLLAITKEGFVQYPLGPFVPEAGPGLTLYQPPEETLVLFRELISLEPSAREVHKRVIQYADVGNGKIRRWQVGSRLAALLPNLSFNKSFSWGNSIDLDRGGTNDPDRYISGPDDVGKGGYRTLSWSFGDMIYS